MAEGGSVELDSNKQGEGISSETMPGQHPIAQMLKEAGVASGPDSSIDWLYEKNKRERMCEIRSLRLGEKPVTGHQRKEIINEFLQSKIEASEKAASGSNVPSNSQRVEEHRPEAVVVEVSGLFERRPVSSMLQSDAFRRDLERIVRGSVSQFRQVSTGANTRGSATQVQTSPHSSSPVTRDAPTALPQRLSRSRASSMSSSTSSQLAGAAAAPQRTQTPPIAWVETPSTTRGAPQPPPPPPPAVLPPSERTVPQGPGSPWLARVPNWHVPTNREELSRGERQRLAWNSIEQSQRENIISEISELVHRQIVTSALDGEFRGSLELHMQSHLQMSGIDGTEVEEFVQNIPQSQYIPRNDFSELGISAPAPPPAASVSDFDSASSIISATAHRVPYAQTNLAMSREMHALKAQLEELKQMMSLSFNVQCDIQRSIRQEVAAAMNQAQQEQAATATPRVRSVPVDDTHCLICLEGKADTVIYSCGHLCLCQKCGYTLQNTGGKCPVCRAPIKDLLKVFKCSPE